MKRFSPSIHTFAWAISLGLITLVTTPGSQAGAPTPIILPQAHVNVAIPVQTQSGIKISVKAGGNLQAALDQARPGDTVELQAGATFTAPSGGFILRPKNGTSWITIQSSAMANLAPGRRVTPLDARYMARIVQPGSGVAITLQQTASYYRLQGLEVTSTNMVGGPNSLGMSFGLVSLGLNNETSTTRVPHHIILDRMYIHGHPKLHCKWGVNLNSAHAAVINSYLSELHTVGQDGQAITSTVSQGPLLIHNNRLEAATENVMFGGAAIPNNSVLPADITITRNYFYTPETWNPKSSKFIPVGYPATRWLKKNLLEFKVGRRVLVEGNVFDGSWVDGQTGIAILIKSSNQTVPSNFAVSEHITVRNNLIKNAASPISLAGATAGTTVVTHHLLVENNLAYDMNVAPFNGDSRTVLWLGGIYNVVMRKNTFVAPKGSQSAITAMLSSANSVFSDNVLTQGTYGYTCSGAGFGSAALVKCLPAGTISNNGLIGLKPYSTYNSEVSMAGTLADAFVDPANKDFRINISGPFSGQGMGANVTQVLQMTQGVQ